MTRRTRRRSSFWRIALLLVLIGIGLYVNQVVVPATPPLFIPTATPTTSPESFLNQAQELSKGGKLTQAIEAYKKAVDADPTNAASYVELARLQVFAGEYGDAIINTQNALLKNPNNPMAHAVQGWALGMQKKYGEAETEIKKAMDIDPNLAVAHAYYAEILTYQGEDDYALYEKAAQESKIAKDLDPNALESFRARGIVLLYTNNLDQAIEEFKSALAINKNIADLHLFLGTTYRLAEKYDLAQESLLAAYSLNPKDTVALRELSAAFFADGRYAQASQYAEEAVRIDPGNASLHGYLGITYYRQKLYDKAIPELALAVNGGKVETGETVEGFPLSYDPRVMEYYWYYGFSLARTNRCSLAVPIFQRLLSEVSENEIAVYNANEGLAVCQENLQTPEAGPVVEDATATPEP